MVLRVKLEVVPFGEEDKAYEIGRLDIFNKGPAVLWSSPNSGNCLYGTINLTPGQEGEYIFDVTHRRTDGAWRLLGKVINTLGFDGP